MINLYKKITDETLGAYFDEILNDKSCAFAKKTAYAMRYTTCLSGKRLRAILCLESCKISSGDYFAAIPSACALEMLHAQSLIHDDLPAMDNDDLRRGQPSNHKVFGEATAILAGDALISLGAQIIMDKTPKSVPVQSILNAVREYLTAAGIFGIVGGQTADIEAEENKNETEEYLQYIQKYKTGALFTSSCLIGGIIGNADTKKLACLKEFSESFGEAFQMADDILDVVSTPEIMGKATGKDACENKLTYVKKYGLKGAKEKLIGKINETYDILKTNGMTSEVFGKITDGLMKKTL